MGAIIYTENERKQIQLIMDMTVRKHTPCDKTGFEPSGKTCKCMKISRWLRALLAARIPKEYWALDYSLSLKSTLDDYFKDKENISDGFGYYLFGAYGVGKTTTLAEIGKRFLVQGKRVIYFMLSEFMDTVYRGFHSKEDDEDVSRDELKILSDRIKDADVFLIDEFDKAYIKPGSDFVLREVESFIRSRLMNNYPVFIASNTKLNDLSKVFGGDSLGAIIRRKLDTETLSVRLNVDKRPKLSSIAKNKGVADLAELYHKIYASRFMNESQL